jgi:hypothetical protein
VPFQFICDALWLAGVKETIYTPAVAFMIAIGGQLGLLSLTPAIFPLVKSTRLCSHISSFSGVVFDIVLPQSVLKGPI